MTPNKILYLVILVCSIVLSGFLGYQFGFKQLTNSAPDNIEYIDQNISIDNELSSVKFRPIIGPRNYGVKLSDNKPYFRGQLVYKINDGDTLVRIIMQDIPTTINTPEDKKNNIPAQNVNVPKTFRVEKAKLSPFTEALEFEEFSEITVNPPVDGVYTADKSTTVANKDEFNFADYDLLFFFDSAKEVQNLYEFNLEGYSIPEDKKRPFFWVYIK